MIRKLMSRLAAASAGIVLVVMAGCQSFQPAPRRSLLDPILTPLSNESQATWGPMMYVAGLTALTGMIVWWGLKAPRTGIGMIISALGLGLAARILQEYELAFALALLGLSAGLVIYAAVDRSFRLKLLGHAADLRNQGRDLEATALEKEAKDEMRKECRDGPCNSADRQRDSDPVVSADD